MTHQEKIAVIQACIDRKPIQSRRLDCCPDGWVDDPSPTFDFCHREYRVRPEPRVFWLNVYTHGNHCGYDSKEMALSCRSQITDYLGTIRVREVEG